LSSSETFYWHDYETFGVDPAWDRPAQFAGLRTTLDLDPVGEPLVLFAKPPRDYLPQPAACLVTGITPQRADEGGVVEAAFIAAIEAELLVPGTCAAGYNSLRFDDTVTRFTLYRNLREPYAREFGDGRSRWDLIDAMRTAYALRPEGIEWPRRDDGLPSFRLEDLTRANGLEHGAAHDALGDVRATIAVAGLLKARQPRLFDWLFRQRSKQAAQALIRVGDLEPLLHVSGRFGAARANLGLIVPLAWHPANANEVICADLSVDTALLIDLPAEELARLLYTRGEDLVEGEMRPGLKSVHINRCPVLLPAKMADERVASRASLNLPACRENLARLRDHEQRHPRALHDKLRAMARPEERREADDVDRALYSGGFYPDADRRLLERLHTLAPAQLATEAMAFEDPRLSELLFRYRARNFPETLDAREKERWESFRFERLTSEDAPGLDLAAYQEEIETRLEAGELSDRDRRVLEALQAWGDSLLA
jgi:exodeoxyribonuclease-1